MAKRNAQATRQLRKLENSFERQARILTGDSNLNVRVGGYRSSFDGKTIFVASNADQLTGDDRVKVEGTFDHEVGHKAAEDVAKLRQSAGLRVSTPLELLRSKRTKREALILNAFEDVRIERIQSFRLPGSGDNIKRSNVIAANEYVEAAKRGDAPDFWQCIAASIIFGAYGMDIHEWLPPVFRPVVNKIGPEINAAMSAEWVEDADELAQSVLQKIKDLRDEVEQAKEDAEKEDPKGQDAEESEESEAGGQESEEKDGQAGGTGSNFDENAEDDSEQAGTDEDGSGGAQGESEDVDLDELSELLDESQEDAEISDLQDRVRDDLEAKCKMAGQSNPTYTPNPKAIAEDKWTEIPTGSASDYVREKDRVSSQISAMRAKLVAELRAKAARRFVGDKTRGTIDTGSLYLLRMGSKNVFAEQTQELTEKVAVSILVDQSGSMYGQKIVKARQSAIAIGETLHGLGVSFEIVGFENQGFGYSRDDRDYDRNERFHYHVYKTFDQNFNVRKTSLVNMEAGGGNNDGEAVLAMAKRIVVRPETRKILIVLSDGQPVGGRRSMGGGQDLCERFLSESVAKISKAGIEIYGVGIMTNDVQKFYKRQNGSSHVVVNKIDELAVKVFSLLKGKLLQGGRRAA